MSLYQAYGLDIPYKTTAEYEVAYGVRPEHVAYYELYHMADLPLGKYTQQCLDENKIETAADLKNFVYQNRLYEFPYLGVRNVSDIMRLQAFMRDNSCPSFEDYVTKTRSETIAIVRAGNLWADQEFPGWRGWMNVPAFEDDLPPNSYPTIEAYDAAYGIENEIVRLENVTFQKAFAAETRNKALLDTLENHGLYNLADVRHKSYLELLQLPGMTQKRFTQLIDLISENHGVLRNDYENLIEDAFKAKIIKPELIALPATPHIIHTYYTKNKSSLQIEPVSVEDLPRVEAELGIDDGNRAFLNYFTVERAAKEGAGLKEFYNDTLSVRSVNLLQGIGVNSAADLRMWDFKDIAELPGLGHKSLVEIVHWIDETGAYTRADSRVKTNGYAIPNLTTSPALVVERIKASEEKTRAAYPDYAAQRDIAAAMAQNTQLLSPNSSETKSKSPDSDLPQP